MVLDLLILVFGVKHIINTSDYPAGGRSGPPRYENTKITPQLFDILFIFSTLIIVQNLFEGQNMNNNFRFLSILSNKYY